VRWNQVEKKKVAALTHRSVFGVFEETIGRVAEIGFQYNWLIK
jgi:hypothetical protein